MTEIALIRPGSTEYDKQGRIQGKLRMPLSPEGRQEVLALVEQLRERRIEVVYASACEPAGETAQLLASSLGAKFRKLDQLANVDHGLWEGCLVEEVRRKHPKVFRQWEEMAENVCPPAGETWGEARARILPIVQRLLRKHRRGTIAVVAPQPLAGLIRLCLDEAGSPQPWVPSLAGNQWELLGPPASPLVGDQFSQHS